MGMTMIQNATEAEIRDVWNIPLLQNVILLLIFVCLECENHFWVVLLHGLASSQVCSSDCHPLLLKSEGKQLLQVSGHCSLCYSPTTLAKTLPKHSPWASSLLFAITASLHHSNTVAVRVFFWKISVYNY